MRLVLHDPSYCTRCNHWMLVTCVEAAGPHVTAAQLCAHCGAHRERVDTLAREPDEDELRHLGVTAFG